MLLLQRRMNAFHRRLTVSLDFRDVFHQEAKLGRLLRRITDLVGDKRRFIICTRNKSKITHTVKEMKKKQ